MTTSPTSAAVNHPQEQYIRARDNPFFEGMRKGEAAIMNKDSSVPWNVRVRGGIGRTASDIGSRRSRKSIGQVLDIPVGNPSANSTSVQVLNPAYGKASSARWSEIPETSPTPDTQFELMFEIKEAREVNKKPSGEALGENEECKTLIPFVKPALKKSYIINKGGDSLSKVPLPPSAALFYRGHSPHMEVVESCESIYRLNMYLKDRKHDVSAGVPGEFLHAVIGPDICDVGSVASTIMYAFYLNEWLKNSQFCTVPIINMKRTDLNSHAELKWLFDSCHVDQSSFVFLDEIDLSYYEIFGSLKLVLLNSNQLPAKQEILKESLVEIFSCGKQENASAYPWVENFTSGQEASCCTLIAEKFLLTSPQILSGQGFARLLLSGILSDTGNLRSSQTTAKDEYMATLLINGAGRYGCNGLYQILRYKMYDVADLRLGEIMRKDFKKWTRMGLMLFLQHDYFIDSTVLFLNMVMLLQLFYRLYCFVLEHVYALYCLLMCPRNCKSLVEPGKLDGTSSRMTVSNIGMSSIGIPILQFLSLDLGADITQFQRLERLSVLAVVSGYLDIEKKFKREILFCTDSIELLGKLIMFIKSSATDLPLKILDHPDLSVEMKAFEINKVTSRKTIERVLEEFIEMSK